jgi:hypothetical protein
VTDNEFRDRLRRALASLGRPSSDLSSRVRDRLVRGSSPGSRTGFVLSVGVTAILLVGVLGAAAELRLHRPGDKSTADSVAATASPSVEPGSSSSSATAQGTTSASTSSSASSSTAGTTSSQASSTPMPTVSAPPPLPACSAADVKATVETDRASYQPGQSVTITTTITNLSSKTCDARGVNDAIVVRNSSGTLVYRCPIAAAATSPYPVAWKPGETMHDYCTWPQTVESGNPPSSPQSAAPPGKYEAEATWSVPQLGPTDSWFSVQAPPTSTATATPLLP